MPRSRPICGFSSAQVSERLQAARFQMQFNQRVAHVAESVDTLALACTEVSPSLFDSICSSGRAFTGAICSASLLSFQSRVERCCLRYNMQLVVSPLEPCIFQVRSCALLPTVLKVSLAVGNFLNTGNRNGAAAGFKLDALLKFKDVRSTGGR